MENPHNGFCSNWAATALLLMYAGLTAVGGPLSKEMKRAGVRASSAAVGPAARWGKREEPRWAFMIFGWARDPARWAVRGNEGQGV
jgi:hypothetical protein